MKDYIVPYIISQGGDWWGGVDIYNHNETEMSVTTKIQRISGVIAHQRTDNIAAFGHLVLTPTDLNVNVNDPTGRITVLIQGPENLMITPFLGCNDSQGKTTGFGTVNLYEDGILKN